MALQLQLTQEIEVMRIELEGKFNNQRIIDLENEVRNRKRIVVNLLAENVITMKHGVKDGNEVVKRTDREYMLDAMLANRKRKIKQVQELTKKAQDRKAEL